jgi:hypothetical protein
MKALKAGIIWEGASLIDGAPIVAIATTGSKNSKTGAMVQTWIVRADMLATDAIHTGEDYSICGNCPKRGTVINGKNTKRECYVKVFQAPRSVSAKYLRNGYERIDAADMGAGRMVRIGSYGDPAAVPAHVWEALVSRASGHTGYTHQWREEHAVSMKGLLMASADSIDEAREAQGQGWRTFRVSERGIHGLIDNEITCPASKEAGQRTTCEACGLCRGATPEGRKRSIPSITIATH